MQKRSGGAAMDSVAGLFHRCAQQAAGAGFLHEGNQTELASIGAGGELELNILGERASFGQLAELSKLLLDGNVNQMAAAIFSSQNLRLDVTESEGDVDIGCALAGIGVGFNVGA